MLHANRSAFPRGTEMRLPRIEPLPHPARRTVKAILKPVYQPVYNLGTGEILYYEALARVKTDGAHGHMRLVEMGEAMGFIALVDLAMLDYAAAALEANPAAVVAVNVSGGTIERSANEYLAEVFRRLSFAPRMVFELTETREIRNQRMLECFLNAVTLLGAKVAADDYGSGYCTSEFVSRTRAHYVKLSGDVVAALAEGQGRAELESLEERLRAWGGELIAEHVDNARKAAAVKRLGIRYAQGFWVGDFVSDLSQALRPGAVPVGTPAAA